MRFKTSLSTAVFALLVAGIILPIAICLVLGLAALLTTMGDSLGGMVLRYVALAGGAFWGVVLVVLILLQAIISLGQSNSDD